MVKENKSVIPNNELGSLDWWYALSLTFLSGSAMVMKECGNTCSICMCLYLHSLDLLRYSGRLRTASPCVLGVGEAFVPYITSSQHSGVDARIQLWAFVWHLQILTGLLSQAAFITSHTSFPQQALALPFQYWQLLLHGVSKSSKGTLSGCGFGSKANVQPFFKPWLSPITGRSIMSIVAGPDCMDRLQPSRGVTRCAASCFVARFVRSGG